MFVKVHEAEKKICVKRNLVKMKQQRRKFCFVIHILFYLYVYIYSFVCIFSISNLCESRKFDKSHRLKRRGGIENNTPTNHLNTGTVSALSSLVCISGYANNFHNQLSK